MRTASLGLAACVIVSTITVVAQANESRESRHTTPSGPGNYVIQLLNYGELQSTLVGDEEGEGELRTVTVELSSAPYSFNGEEIPIQYDRRTFTRPYIWSSNGLQGNLSYLPIRHGHMVRLGNPRGPEPAGNLWLITRATYGRDHEVQQRIYFKVKVSARELDCAGKRVCRRGNTGHWYFDASLPVIWDPPAECGPSNTFKIEPIDGEISITSPEARFRARGHRYFGSEPDSRFQRYGPELRLFNAEICVTRSTREPWPQNPDRVFREQRDQADQIGRRNRNRIGSDLKDN